MSFDDAYAGAGRLSYRLLAAAGGGGLIGEAERLAASDTETALSFAGLELGTAEVTSLALLAAAGALLLVLATGLTAVAWGLLDGATAGLLLLCAGLVPLLAFAYVAGYPWRRAAYLRLHSLGDVPEVISYIVMAMKLNPNLERALAFAMKNSRRQLARDVRKLMWDMQVRAYDSLDDALAAFAERWGKQSDHFRRSVFIIKSATCERDEALRTIALNRALDVVLDGTRSLMGEFSARLHGPTLLLYSIFVMVPLALVAMLPAAAVVGLRANALELFLLYDLLFPLVTMAYAGSILAGRPAAFAPPDIPADHPLASRRARWAWAALGLAAGGALCCGYALAPPGLLPLPSSIWIVWGSAAAIAVYCYGSCLPYKRARDEIVAMEAEFADSLFVLGRRLAEGRPPEEGFAYTARAIEGTAIGRAYAAAAYNIRCLRATLHDAVLDEAYGAFSAVYSDRIRATIGMLVETSALSGEVAGSSIIKLADHLKELQGVEEEIRRMLYTMTSMLRTTCAIFAPFIAGVTLALSGSVADIVARTAADMQALPESARPYFPLVPQISAPGVSQADFTLIVGVYLILLVLILLRFVDGIEHGDDLREFMYSAGRTLPVAVITFSLTTAAASALFKGMM